MQASVTVFKRARLNPVFRSKSPVLKAGPTYLPPLPQLHEAQAVCKFLGSSRKSQRLDSGLMWSTFMRTPSFAEHPQMTQAGQRVRVS